MEADKDLLISAIKGRGFHSMTYADKMEKAGFARFSGNQHNPEWVWLREKLALLSYSQLEAIYRENA